MADYVCMICSVSWLRGASFVALFSFCLPYNALAQQIEIPEGTKVKVRLDQPLTSETAEEGQPVQLGVSEDIRLNDSVVILRDSVVHGTIMQAVPKRRMGRTGKLDFSIDDIVAADGTKIPLRYSPVKKEGGSHSVRTGVITAGVAVLFWPAAPFVLLTKGKESTFAKGMTFEVFTDAKVSIRAKGGAAPIAVTSVEPAAAKANVVITSDPAGADILVDGAFVGSTPSTLQLAPGMHSVKVTKDAMTWERSVNFLAGSSLNLTAALEAKPK